MLLLVHYFFQLLRQPLIKIKVLTAGLQKIVVNLISSGVCKQTLSKGIHFSAELF
jgi:hypothetical protein